MLERGQRGEIGGDEVGPAEIARKAPLPGGRQFERREHGPEQAGVADAQAWRREAVALHAVEREREDLGIGRGGVGPADQFDAGLQELAGPAGPVPEGRPVIAIGAEARRIAAGDMIAADRNGQLGPQAEFAALAVARQVEALCELFAGKVEEQLGRLQDRGLDRLVARRHEGRQEGLAAVRRYARCAVHAPRAFSEEVDTGSSKENATTQYSRAVIRSIGSDHSSGPGGVIAGLGGCERRGRSPN